MGYRDKVIQHHSETEIVILLMSIQLLEVVQWLQTVSPRLSKTTQQRRNNKHVLKCKRIHCWVQNLVPTTTLILRRKGARLWLEVLLMSIQLLEVVQWLQTVSPRLSKTTQQRRNNKHVLKCKRIHCWVQNLVPTTTLILRRKGARLWLEVLRDKQGTPQ